MTNTIKVLIVDDELALLLKESLSYYGITNVTAIENGKEAWELLQHETFDVAIIDHNMPGMLGSDLIKNIKTAGIKIGILYHTGSLDSVIAEILKSFPDIDYISKPASIKDIYTKVLALGKLA